jgi:hypothetical protein
MVILTVIYQCPLSETMMHGSYKVDDASNERNGKRGKSGRI